MSRALFSRLLLILALLVAQMGGLAHGISHIIEQTGRTDQSLPHDKYCGQCAAYGQIGSAIGSSSISFAGGESFETPAVSEPVSYISASFVVFSARAPPYSA